MHGRTLVEAGLELRFLIVRVEPLGDSRHVHDDVLGLATTRVLLVLTVLENEERRIGVEVENCRANEKTL